MAGTAGSIEPFPGEVLSERREIRAQLGKVSPAPSLLRANRPLTKRGLMEVCHRAFSGRQGHVCETHHIAPVALSLVCGHSTFKQETNLSSLSLCGKRNNGTIVHSV